MLAFAHLTALASLSYERVCRPVAAVHTALTALRSRHIRSFNLLSNQFNCEMALRCTSYFPFGLIGTCDQFRFSGGLFRCGLNAAQT